MDRRIIIKAEDLDREIHFLLSEISADMPIDWDSNVLALVRDSVIEAFGRMEVTLEVDERVDLMQTAQRDGSDPARVQRKHPLAA